MADPEVGSLRTEGENSCLAPNMANGWFDVLMEFEWSGDVFQMFRAIVIARCNLSRNTGVRRRSID
jgi:hypothetical protein